jgi:hypothetical protein
MPGGDTYVSGTPDFSHRTFSKGQKDHQSRFRQASAFARQAAKTQPIYAQLAEGTVKSAYNFALSDWFNPPVIHAIEREAGHVIVRASDNVMVTRVQVTVLDEQGNAIEKGDAVQRKGEWWELPSTANGKIVAEAWDLAGNTVRKEL